MDVAVHGAVGLGLAGEAGSSVPSMTTVIARERAWAAAARFPGWRRSVLVVGLREPGPDLVVHLAGGGQQDPDGGLAEVPGGLDPPPGRGGVQAQAEVDADLVVGFSTANVRRGETSETSVRAPGR